MKAQDILSLAEDVKALEALEKACPRCGKPSADPSNPSGRCSACLKKLRENKKKPGHYLHEHKLADDALKRQDGKTNTSSKKSNGRGSRKSIIRQVRNAYNKHGKGTTLSPDRKNNDKGYSSSNTRMVPQKLNRGRHNVNNKKLKNWQKKLKKADVTFDVFKALVSAKALEHNDEYLYSQIKDLTLDQLTDILDNQ